MQFVPQMFPLSIAGVALDIQDHPGGSVAKIICYEAERQYRLQDIPFADGDVAVDIGAHVGVVTCYLAKAHPGIRVIAVEPVRRLYDYLSANVVANGVANRVKLYALAIGQDGGEVTLYGDLGLNSGGSSVYGRGGPAIEHAPSMALERCLDTYAPGRIRLLKIDCEGAEHEALTDAVLDRVDYLVGEFHDGPAFEALGYSAAALKRRCEAKLGADRVRVGIVQVG
ncbi:MAG: FkbM family methyltransferase [Bradyrhizobium sp.]|uniref:FkbM family methyltransferase n=1 Tax=Bradyrhizobium sp. TaxID=376 RepID=UPI003D0BDF76